MDFSNFTISDCLIILATLLGPIIAIQTQKQIDVWKEKRNSKLRIFYDLMSTRGNKVSQRHVEALNSIQLEYSSNKPKEKKVKDSWAEYHSHLNDSAGNGIDLSLWAQKGNELFTNLLHEMSQYLRYNYNKVDIQKGGYTPIAHEDKEIMEHSIAKGLENILSGRESLKVKLTSEQNPTT